MKNSKKLVSILLAVILTVSSIACVASFSASAADSKLSVTASSNFFPERTETFNADTDTLTVSFYIKSDQMMLNSQWNLYFDPEVLAYDDTDGVNQTGIYYEGELLGYELNISPVAIEDGYIINTGMIPEKICSECPACYMKASASNTFAFRKKSIERLRADLPCKLPIGSF